MNSTGKPRTVSLEGEKKECSKNITLSSASHLFHENCFLFSFQQLPKCANMYRAVRVGANCGKFSSISSS